MNAVQKSTKVDSIVKRGLIRYFRVADLLVENAAAPDHCTCNTQPTTLNMASSSTQSPAARQTTGKLPALTQPIADKVAWTQGGRTRKRMLNSRQIHENKQT